MTDIEDMSENRGVDIVATTDHSHVIVGKIIVTYNTASHILYYESIQIMLFNSSLSNFSFFSFKQTLT